MLTLLLFACTSSGPAESDSGALDPSDSELFDPAPNREYSCGWAAADPGTLEATGNQVGDVVQDFTGNDQCGEEYHVWDGYGRLTYLMAPPHW